jgi:hypothetical protein
MRFRFAILLALAPVVAACATNPTRVLDGDSVLANLRTEGKGIVLIHTTLHDHLCNSITAKVAHPDSDGRWVAGEEINLKLILNLRGDPSEVVLPAGDYGLVSLHCVSSLENRSFHARPLKRGNILTGEGAIYEQPIARFSVQAGEFVNVGSLQLSSTPSGVLGVPSSFRAYVEPLDESKVQALAAKKPALYAQLVQRLMTVPAQAQQPAPSAPRAPPIQNQQAPTTPIEMPNRKG